MVKVVDEEGGQQKEDPWGPQEVPYRLAQVNSALNVGSLCVSGQDTGAIPAPNHLCRAEHYGDG